MVKVAIVAVCIGGPTWWLAQRQDRVGNEQRLREVASAIAGRPVQVRCPGVYGRVVSWDTVEGTVRFDADGRPSDDEVLGYLADHAEGVRLGEMEAYFNAPRRELAEVINELVEDDRVRRDDERRVYFAADGDHQDGEQDER